MAIFFSTELGNPATGQPSEYPASPTAADIQQYDVDVCGKLYAYYLEENKGMSLSDADSLQQLNDFATAKQLAETGSAHLLLGLLMQIPVNTTYWTQARKDFYVNELLEWETFKTTNF